MSDPRIDIIASRIEHMALTLDKVADAVSRLAVVEERQQQTQSTLGRVFKQLDDHDERLDSLEKHEPEQKRVAKWVNAAVWAMASAAAMFIAHRVGLL